MYIPPGYGTVFPYMLVERTAEFVDFLKRAFDAEELGRTVAPDGRIANCRLRIGTTSFMTSEPAGTSMEPLPATYYIYVENADQTLQRALECGATKMFDTTDMPYGDRQAGVVDPFRNIWWISQRLRQEPYDA